jgi:hypothetical protein
VAVSAVDRAAEVIALSVDTWQPLLGPRQTNADVVARALADAGLLVTDEIQAVLDALDARARTEAALVAYHADPEKPHTLSLRWTSLAQDYSDADDALNAAHAAYLASRQP